MFIQFDQVDRCRLNKGTRGRLVDQVKQLMDKKQMKGFDVQYIYEQTSQLRDDKKPERNCEINFLC